MILKYGRRDTAPYMCDREKKCAYPCKGMVEGCILMLNWPIVAARSRVFPMSQLLRRNL